MRELRPHVATAIALTAWAAAFQTAVAQVESEVRSVNLLVSELISERRSKGLLYRSFVASRKHVADVNEDGTLDRTIKCKAGDKFEAKADSSFDRPIAPVQIVCNPQMTFKFTRMFYLSYPADQPATPLASTEQPHVYAQYASIFAKSGNVVAAGALNEASVLAVAADLGDKSFDRFVYRDAGDGFKLKLSAEGSAALKVKQRNLGVAETGLLDGVTTSAIAKQVPGSDSTPALRCDKQQSGASYKQKFLCAQIADIEVPRVTNNANTMVLPRQFIRG